MTGGTKCFAIQQSAELASSLASTLGLSVTHGADEDRGSVPSSVGSGMEGCNFLGSEFVEGSACMHNTCASDEEHEDVVDGTGVGGDVVDGTGMGGDVVDGTGMGGDVVDGTGMGGDVVDGTGMGGDVVDGTGMGGDVVDGTGMGGDVVDGTGMGGDVVDGTGMGGVVDGTDMGGVVDGTGMGGVGMGGVVDGTGGVGRSNANGTGVGGDDKHVAGGETRNDANRELYSVNQSPVDTQELLDRLSATANITTINKKKKKLGIQNIKLRSLRSRTKSDRNLK